VLSSLITYYFQWCDLRDQGKNEAANGMRGAQQEPVWRFKSQQKRRAKVNSNIWRSLAIYLESNHYSSSKSTPHFWGHFGSGCEKARDGYILSPIKHLGSVVGQ
jgi:hypothetical protein